MQFIESAPLGTEQVDNHEEQIWGGGGEQDMQNKTYVHIKP